MSLQGYSAAYYNNAYYSGTAAISMNNSLSYTNVHEMAMGNQLFENRFELSDGAGSGGQLFVDPSASNATVVSNIIDGGYWFIYAPSTGTASVNGCPLVVQQSGIQETAGVEGYGTSNYFYNNEVFAHSGTGMQFGDFTGDTSGIYVSGSNPWNMSDPLHYVHHNYWNGLWFLGTASSNGVSNLALDGVRVCSNGYSTTPATPHYYAAPFGDSGVAFEYASGAGFITCSASNEPCNDGIGDAGGGGSATMSNNYPGDINITTGTGPTNINPTKTSCPNPVP